MSLEEMYDVEAFEELLELMNEHHLSIKDLKEILENVYYGGSKILKNIEIEDDRIYVEFPEDSEIAITECDAHKGYIQIQFNK